MTMKARVFRKNSSCMERLAGATYNKSYIFTTANGAEFPAQGQQKFILATNKWEMIPLKQMM